MPRYLFTSDQRISSLSERIQKVAKHVTDGHSLSEITDKSDNNNATTLKAYYCLNEGSDVCKQSVYNPQYAIRNFVKKFQFPNVRTQESLNDSIEDGILLAPFRVVVSLLAEMAAADSNKNSFITYDEILFYIFGDPVIYKNPNIDYKQLANRIITGRPKETDLTTKIDSVISWKQHDRQIGEMMSVLPQASKAFKIANRKIHFSLSSDAYTTDINYINDIINYQYLWYPSDPNNYSKSSQEYFKYMDTSKSSFSVIDINALKVKDETKSKDTSDVESGLNKIFYGAPGTGKSHTVDNDYVKSHKCFRITFHPDTDYASFVGCYKPTMDKDKPDEITYSFVPQVFINAYVYAWNHPDEPTFLVIEELNRGNCAQIFGDVFQLLDRQHEGHPGYSKYTINADSDIANYLEKWIDNADSKYKNAITEIYNPKDFDFSIMALPKNLCILATMNTSDQSLFPIDSAFKRRWEMEYVKVNYEDAEQFYVEIDKEHKYNWRDILLSFNKYIKGHTQSTNKILGNRFVQPKTGDTIDCDTFRDKVLFFLFNDVFKDNEDFTNDFFPPETEDKFFETLCESSDTNLITRFIEDVCHVKNTVTPAPSEEAAKPEEATKEPEA